MRLLAISGSLRSQSKNTSLLKALALLAPPGLEVVLYRELHLIPPFNPDLEAEADSGPVARFRSEIEESDAVLFSTPEYAHGIPGSLKNALDWIVGTGELSQKPVALIHASSRAVFARESLREILKTMDARVIDAAEVTVDLTGKPPTEAAIVEISEFASALVFSLRRIVEAFAKNP